MMTPSMRESFLAQFLRWLIYATALVPLVIFSQYISPFHFGKVVVFRSIVEIMLVLYVALAWRDRSYLPKPNPIFWSFLAFALAFTAATVASFLPYPSFWGTLERMGGLWTFWHYFVYFVILTSVLRTRDHWMRLIDVMLVAGILSALYGFLQRTDISAVIGSGGRQRIFGTIGNPALFGGYQLINVFLALTLAMREHVPYRKIIQWSMVGLGTLAVLMTVVRGSILGLAAGFFVFIVLNFYHYRQPVMRKGLIMIGVAAALFTLVAATPLRDSAFIESSSFLSRLTDTSFGSFTAKTRFWAWEAGLKGWSESFKTIVFGWGPENFNIPFARYFNPKFFTGLGSETLFDRAHNMFVEILVTMGLAGFLTYASIFVAMFRKLIPSLRQRSDMTPYAIGLSSLLVAYILHNSFIFDTSANFLVFFTVLGFAVHLYYPHQERKDVPGPVPAPALRVAVVGILSLAVAVSIIKTNITPAKANYALTRAIVRGWTLDEIERRDKVGTPVAPQNRIGFSDVINQYKIALGYDVPGKYEYRHRFAQYLLEYSASHPVEGALADAVRYCIEQVAKSINENPGDYLPELYASRLNIVLGKDNPASPHNDIALQHSTKALEYSPTFIRTFYEIGQAYLNKKQYETTIEYFQKAIDLNPDVGISYWYLAMVELQIGKETKSADRIRQGIKSSEEAIVHGYSPSELEHLRVVNAALELKDYEQLVRSYERLIAISKTNVSYYESLAFSYAEVGRIDDAVRTAREAVKIDPSILPRARTFVQSLGREL